MNQRWLEKPGKLRSKKRQALAEGAAADDGNDPAFEERSDKYEQAYNFRFEEGNTEIIGHARRSAEDTEGMARRPDERRKKKRAEKKQRREREREAAAAELRRLKNLKKRELQARLKAAGVRAVFHFLQRMCCSRACRSHMVGGAGSRWRATAPIFALRREMG
jgi:hypothetical protein